MKVRNGRTFAKTLLASAVTALCFSTPNAYAGGFSLFGEGNGLNAGDFGAGVAAEAGDASTLNYNPAGLARLKGQQLVVSGNYVAVSGKFNGTSTWSTTTVPLTFTQTANNVSGGRNGFIPAFYYSRQLTDKLGFGVGAYVPFGLETNWSPLGPVRYAATKSSLHVINVAPGLGAKVTDRLSFGAAFDFQYAKVNLSSVVGIPIAPRPFTPTFFDSTSSNTGVSFGFGGHAGLLFQPDEHTRVGLTYFSRIQHQFEGSSTLTGQIVTGGAGVGTFRSTALFSDTATFPAHVVLSGYRDVNNKVALMGTVAWVEWSTLTHLAMNNLAAPGPAFARVVVPENFRNTWRVAGGMKYHVNEKVTLRGGVGYDQTPTNNADRNLRLPDGNRVAVAVGGHYQYNDKLGVDVGWTHLFMKRARINNTTVVTTSRVNVVGNVRGHANIFGGQLTWKIA